MSNANNFARIAPAAFAGEASRMVLCDAVRDSVQPFRWQKPDAEGKRAMVPAMRQRFDTAKVEHSIGFIAARCFGNKPESEALKLARDVLAKANPDAKGKAPNGRRTEAEQRAYKAANMAWSRIVADIPGLTAPHGNAGNANAKDKPRTPKANESTAGLIPANKVTEAIGAALPDKAKDADAVKQNVGRMAAAIMAYVNKHAAVADNTTKSYAQDIVALARKVAILPKADK